MEKKDCKVPDMALFENAKGFGLASAFSFDLFGLWVGE
jgi:hypothetical protein